MYMAAAVAHENIVFKRDTYLNVNVVTNIVTLRSIQCISKCNDTCSVCQWYVFIDPQTLHVHCLDEILFASDHEFAIMF